MIELNLIPDVKLELLKARKQQAMVISGAIIVSIVVGSIVTALALYVFGAQTLVSKTADDDTTRLMSDLQSVKDLEKTLTVQQQIASIDTQQNNKLISSRMLDVLTATIPSDKNKVKITTANLNTEDKTIVIEGEAENGYEALEVFKKTIADTEFSKDFKRVYPIYDWNAKEFYFEIRSLDGYKRSFPLKYYYLPITTPRINNNPKLVENPNY